MKKFTQLERSWILYDVANSAFVLFATSVIPIYFAAIAPGENIVVAWGYAETIASLIVALLMPILGSLADFQGQKKKFFMGFFFTGIITCLAMALPLSWLPFLVLYIITSIAISSTFTFYDAMLVDITEDERMNKISSHGYAWGYVGSCIPFIFCIALIFGGPTLLGIETALATRISFIVVGLWWLGFTIPLLKNYEQKYFKVHTPGEKLNPYRLFIDAAKEIINDKFIFIFMIAYFFYIDGVHAVISMATSYGTSLGIDSTQLILALLLTQFVAFPSAIIYSKLADKWGTLKGIKLAVLAYFLIVLFAACFLNSAREFWILAVCVGLFQGGIQALSRSYFGKIVPKEHANQFYGFFQIFGKYSTVMGTFLVAFITQMTGNAAMGILSIALLFIVGLLVLQMLPKERRLHV